MILIDRRDLLEVLVNKLTGEDLVGHKVLIKNNTRLFHNKIGTISFCKEDRFKIKYFIRAENKIAICLFKDFIVLTDSPLGRAIYGRQDSKS